MMQSNEIHTFTVVKIALIYGHLHIFHLHSPTEQIIDVLGNELHAWLKRHPTIYVFDVKVILVLLVYNFMVSYTQNPPRNIGSFKYSQ